MNDPAARSSFGLDTAAPRQLYLMRQLLTAGAGSDFVSSPALFSACAEPCLPFPG